MRLAPIHLDVPPDESRGIQQLLPARPRLLARKRLAASLGRVAIVTYFRSSVELSHEKRPALVEVLNHLLAKSVDLFTQAKHAHWNLKGRDFISAHEPLPT
jgi:hypothetical protein